jgi:hypothetical protein
MMSSGGYEKEENGDRRQGDYNRPRRPNADTIAYLRSLPLDVKTSDEEISRFLSPTEETADRSDYPQSLSAALSAIGEIRNEIASLAGDEYGAQCIEVLARIAIPYSEIASRTLLYGLSTYHLHLATHRYGSHVVQTILELSTTSATDKDMSLDEEAPQLSQGSEQLPRLPDLILGIVDELMPHASQLSVHICGSHVLRTLVCTLGGVKLVSGINKPAETTMRRGRVKGKKKKKKEAENVLAPHAGMMGIEYQTASRLLLDSATEDALVALTHTLSGTLPTEGPGELQQMACHPSAGPLLIILLRVLTYSQVANKKAWQSDERKGADMSDFRLGILKPEPTFQEGSSAHQLAQRILCWQPNVEKQQFAGDVIYGLSGEPRGSHLLETLLRIGSDEFYNMIIECGGFDKPETIQDYCSHDVSNFVVQALLSTARTREQAELLWKTIERAISTGYVLDPKNKRRGIVWRATEMAAKHGVCQQGMLKAIRVGMGVTDKPQEGRDELDVTEKDAKKKKKKRQKDLALSMQECVPKLVNLTPPESDGDRVTLDAAGSRALYHLLRFEPHLCTEVLEGIVKSFTSGELELIAKDGLGSRCIMDGILDGPKEELAFADARKTLLERFNGRLVTLAVDRVGNHTIKKLFKGLTEWEDKAVLTSELAQSLKRLGGNAMGRSVIEACSVSEFLEGQEAWKTAVRKMERREELVHDILAIGEEEKKADKKKRKRKRHKKEELIDNDDRGISTKKSRVGESTNVESIL